MISGLCRTAADLWGPEEPARAAGSAIRGRPSTPKIPILCAPPPGLAYPTVIRSLQMSESQLPHGHVSLPGGCARRLSIGPARAGTGTGPYAGGSICGSAADYSAGDGPFEASATQVRRAINRFPHQGPPARSSSHSRTLASSGSLVTARRCVYGIGLAARAHLSGTERISRADGLIGIRRLR